MNEEIKNNECNTVNKTSEQRFKAKFPLFCVATFVYAVLYAICVFENPSGIGYGVYVVCSLIYIMFCFKEMELPLKRENIFYIITIIALGVATFCTDDWKIIFMNKVAIFILTALFVLDSVFDTRKWKFCKYISSAVITMIMSIAEICELFGNAYTYLKSRKNKRNINLLYGVLGCVIAIPIVAFIFILLSSADIVFREWASNIFDDINIVDIIIMTIMFCFMFMASYCLMSYLSKRELNETVKDNKKIEPLMVIPVTTMLTILYIIFAGIQVVYLFIGKMKLPEGYTYSEYAREGFFQLLVVSVINLIIVLVCVGFAKSNKVLKGILTVMTLCTFVMIASSAARMLTYMQYYYLTFLRIFVLWSLLVLTFVFVGVLIYIYKDKFPIFKYVVMIVTYLYMAFAFSHPDYIVAKVNLGATEGKESQFFLGEGFDDYDFLAYLSADGATAVAQWIDEQGYAYDIGKPYINHKYLFFYTPQEYGENYMCMISEKTKDMGIKDFNFSRYTAKKLIK